MADPTGTPLWLTLLLQAATLFATHRFTAKREKDRRSDDRLKDWRKEQEALLREVVDLSMVHYLDPSSLPGTTVSAARIVDKLRRFRSRLGHFATVDMSDAPKANSLYIELHGLITGSEDFQRSDRSVRNLDDDFLESIRECEEALLRNLAKPRRVSD